MKLICICILSWLGASQALGEDVAGKTFGSGRTGLVDKSMNPAISINGLFLGSYGSAWTAPTVTKPAPALGIQEIELAFTATVDPYFLGNFIITADASAVHPEEAYVRTLAIPYVTLTAGQFFANFGKNNLLHTHAQPMIDVPAVNQLFFGAEAFKEVGVDADLLIPLPWYLDLHLSGFGANSGETPFHAGDPAALGLLARLESLWDLRDDTTLGAGVSYTGGGNEFSSTSQYIGADLTLKYLSLRGRGEFGIAWTNEWIYSLSNYQNTPRAVNPSLLGISAVGQNALGGYSTVLVRTSPQFWIGGRFDYVASDVTQPISPNILGENLMVAFVPSEFSTLRVQGGLFQVNNQPSLWQVLVQLNITIGSHPAHAY